MSTKSATSTPVVLNIDSWNPAMNKYMQPKLNKQGGKSITLISKQSSRSLHISTPLMTTWGIGDFVNEQGESDGKYSISLVFPNEDYATKSSTVFLEKMKEFENQIIEDAVANSELWWGEKMSKELVKHTFFPFLKYAKMKDSKKIDTTKPPHIKAKVPIWEGKWGVEIYDTKNNMLFPCENEDMTPMDFVPRLSNVACVIQCGGIWIGGKGWGLTWKLVQCVVKPKEVASVFGRCHVQLSEDEVDTINKQEFDEDVATMQSPVPEPVPALPTPVATAVQSTFVEDSDDEADSKIHPTETPKAVEEVQSAQSPPAIVPVKKVVKKASPAPVEEAAVAVATEAVSESKPVVKKVVKKKVVA
jgi:hypothetical protein